MKYFLISFSCAFLASTYIFWKEEIKKNQQIFLICNTAGDKVLQEVEALQHSMYTLTERNYEIYLLKRRINHGNLRAPKYFN